MGRKKKTEDAFAEEPDLEPAQTEIPGAERKRDKKLESRILFYIEQRDARMACTEEEVKAKKALLAAMEAAGFKPGGSYTMVDGETRHVCTLSTDEVKPKVKTVRPEEK